MEGRNKQHPSRVHGGGACRPGGGFQKLAPAKPRAGKWLFPDNFDSLLGPRTPGSVAFWEPNTLVSTRGLDKCAVSHPGIQAKFTPVVAARRQWQGYMKLPRGFPNLSGKRRWPAQSWWKRVRACTRSHDWTKRPFGPRWRRYHAVDQRRAGTPRRWLGQPEA
ncbi:hypothetical protein C2845_PM09G11810 [Panicum miliaceum]|uniref:Uncharacterized protein n=1 Tax=Panicum miliaceum TaxID=4540 RepID=A0A3L6RXS8_PANMI|nr:hypothetical protein C2845_PM09G11810 [Panicum miliaceum]